MATKTITIDLESVALANNHSILTGNTRHFRHISGLQLVSYGD